MSKHPTARWYAVLLAAVLALMVVAHSHGSPETPASTTGAVIAAAHHGAQAAGPATAGLEDHKGETGAAAGWGDTLLAGTCLTLGVLVLVQARRGPASAALRRVARRAMRHTQAHVPVASARSAVPVAYGLGVMRV